MLSCQNLIPCSLTFCSFNPYLLFKFLIFYVLRFIECVKPRVSKVTGPITVNELSKAQTLWIQSCQLSTYSKEIKNLKNNPTSNKRLPLVRQLRLFLDSSSLLRCGGRIHNAPIGRHAKFPYLLPTKHRLTTLIVHAAHANQLHGGVHRVPSLPCANAIGFQQLVEWLEVY